MTTHIEDSAPATVNADQAELDKFSALASRWWDPESEFKPLHAINPLRLEWIQECAGSLAGKTVLDVGCGGGILSSPWPAPASTVTGIDLAEKSLKIAKLHGLESGVKVEYRKGARRGTGGRAARALRRGHLHGNAGARARSGLGGAGLLHLVKPGGWVFFSTLNRNPKSFLFAIVGAEYVLRLLPRGTHSYEQFIKPSELSAAAPARTWSPCRCAAWNTTRSRRSIPCRPTPRSTT